MAALRDQGSRPVADEALVMRDDTTDTPLGALGESELVHLLRSPDERLREQASRALWDRWFGQKGPAGILRLRRSERLLDEGHAGQAEAELDAILAESPDFAEAWNRRAVLRYLQARYEEAIGDCRQVLELKPWHFGALQGLGLCHLARGEFGHAAEAFRRALEVVPYASVNEVLLRQCLQRMN